MEKFRMFDEQGFSTLITILDNMTVSEATNIILYNGFNDVDNFSMGAEIFMYKGIYFTKKDDDYTIEWGNQSHSHPDMGAIKKFIHRTVLNQLR